MIIEVMTRAPNPLCLLSKDRALEELDEMQNKDEMQDESRIISKYWGVTSFCDNSAPDIVAWKLARSAIEHENSLVNHRMTWFVASQAFLFSAFVLLFLAGSKGDLAIFAPLLPYFLGAIGLFGAYVCLVTQDGLSRAFLATDAITDNYNKLIAVHAPDPIVPPLHYWLAPKVFNLQRLPIATLLLWVLLVFLCVVYSIPDMRSQLQRLTVENALYGLALLLVFGLGYAMRGSRFMRYSQVSIHDPSQRRRKTG